MIIVGNKIDLIDIRKVSLEQLKEMADKYGIEAYESSSKTGEGVKEIFSAITAKLFKNKNIGVVLPGEDGFSTRHGSTMLTREISTSKRVIETENGCNC